MAMMAIPGVGATLSPVNQALTAHEMEVQLWFKTAMNRDKSTGPLARPFACTAHSLACFALLALLTVS